MERINHSLAAFAIAQLTDMNRSLYGSPRFEKKRFEIGEYIRKHMQNFSFFFKFFHAIRLIDQNSIFPPNIPT